MAGFPGCWAGNSPVYLHLMLVIKSLTFSDRNFFKCGVSVPFPVLFISEHSLVNLFTIEHFVTACCFATKYKYFTYL